MSTPLMSTPLMSTPLMSTPLMSTPLMSTPLMSTPLIPRLGFIARSLLTALMCSLAVPALAETIDVYDNHGGSVFQYNARWVGLAARGVDVRIVGPCQSACTILLGHIPRNKICVMPSARFGFHLARREDATQMLWGAYQADIRSWINAHGGLQKNFIWMGAPDVYRYFKRC
jgi:hypothetical protein